METNIRKILLRTLFSLFSILLIIILNNYLNYRFETMREENLQITEKTRQMSDQPLKIVTAWENYSPADMEPAVIGIDHTRVDEEISKSTFTVIPEKKTK